MNTNQPHDASVAVLRQQQQQFDTTLRDLSRAVNEGFANMAAKMDRINELTTTIASITARQESHTEGLNRAFSEVSSLEAKLTQHEQEGINWRDSFSGVVDTRFSTSRTLLDEHKSHTATAFQNVNTEIASWRGAVKGGALVLSMLIGLLGWLGGRYVTSTEKNSAEIAHLGNKVSALERAVSNFPFVVDKKIEESK